MNKMAIPMSCIAILKTGSNKGKQCSSKATIDSYCGRHYSMKESSELNTLTKISPVIVEEKHVPSQSGYGVAKKLHVFEAFAGYGGASFALKKIKYPHEIIGYSEIDKYAIQLYNQNHPGLMNYGDITKIDEKLLPDFDLFTGGFPCQSFSSVGLGLGEADERGILFLDILRIVRHKKPAMILLENVKGLLSKRHMPTLQKIIDELQKIGYYVCYKLLNSKNYGIPQNRERVWIFATTLHKYLDLNASHNTPVMIDIYPAERNQNCKIEKFLDVVPDISLYLSQEQIAKLIEQCGFEMKSEERLCLDLYNKKIRTDGICMTLGGIHNTMRIVEPMINANYRVRKMSIMEQFRLMGFNNDEIDYSGLSYTRLCHIVSNGWDINVVSLIFGTILSRWNTPDTQTNEK
jgi:DNA (cytosine-5)-methyltransferase 1